MEQAAGNAGREVTISFASGRTDASQEQTDVQSSTPLEPIADGLRNYQKTPYSDPAEALLINRAYGRVDEGDQSGPFRQLLNRDCCVSRQSGRYPACRSSSYWDTAIAIPKREEVFRRTAFRSLSRMAAGLATFHCSGMRPERRVESTASNSAGSTGLATCIWKPLARARMRS